MYDDILIDAFSVKEKIITENVVLLDTSWHLPTSERNAKKDYENGHIENAYFFDIDAMSQPDSAYPHTMPPSDWFAEKMGILGFSDKDHYILYDQSPLFSSARVWWMLKNFGANNVQILNGGLNSWIEAGFSLSMQAPSARDKATFCASSMQRSCVYYQDVYEALTNDAIQILDARSPARFSGKADEPRPGISSGHMPSALNLPFNLLLDDNGCMKPASELEAIIEELGVSKSKPIITSCGSGVTAAVVFLALTCLGYDDVSLYDGSWTEWASTENAPIIKG